MATSRIDEMATVKIGLNKLKAYRTEWWLIGLVVPVALYFIWLKTAWEWKYYAGFTLAIVIGAIWNIWFLRGRIKKYTDLIGGIRSGSINAIESDTSEGISEEDKELIRAFRRAKEIAKETSVENAESPMNLIACNGSLYYKRIDSPKEEGVQKIKTSDLRIFAEHLVSCERHILSSPNIFK